MSDLDDYEQAEASDIQASELEAVIEKQAEQIRDYEAALEFYASCEFGLVPPDDWDWAGMGEAPKIEDYNEHEDSGNRAKETLAKWKAK